jgi:hypothetical protein
MLVGARLEVDLTEVWERESRKFTGLLTREDGVTALPASLLNTLTLTLSSLHGAQAIVNSRNDQNVLNANGVTVDESGNFTWLMDALDNQVLDATLPVERHRMLLEATFSGTKAGKFVHDFAVRNLGAVP